MTCVMTIDLEDWFHCLEPDWRRWDKFERRAEVGANQLLSLLSEHDSKATFFVLGDVAQQQPEVVRAIHAAGHEIGTHGMHHEFVSAQTATEFRDDLRKSIDLLEDITSDKVRSYRAPYFSISQSSSWALDIIQREDLEFDSSIFPVRNPRYGVPNARRTPHQIIPGLYEWPISTIPSAIGNLPFAGGIYFRFLPWRFVYANLQRLQRNGEPVLLYLHPWEVDPGQPRYKTDSTFLNLRHYWRLGATLHKMEELLQRMRFSTLASGFDELRKMGKV